MSYERVKGIKIENGEVFINSHSNNDTCPFHYWNCPTLTKILKEKGENALNIEILKEYVNGNFQSSINNKFTRALKVIRYILKDEFKQFEYNWNDNEQIEKVRKARESEEYKALLLKALNTKMPKEKFIIKKPYGHKDIYARKTTNKHLFYTDDIKQAKEFNFKEQAESVLKCYGVNNGEVITR